MKIAPAPLLKRVLGEIFSRTARSCRQPIRVPCNCRGKEIDMAQNWKEQAKRNWIIFGKAGLPYTLVGMVIVFLGFYLLRRYLGDSEYLGTALLMWFAVFWIVYQTLFRRRVQRVADGFKKAPSK